jgi:hypothetical protein
VQQPQLPVNMGALMGHVLMVLQKHQIQLRGDVAMTITTMSIAEGAKFTCFTSRKVQMLTPALRGDVAMTITTMSIAEGAKFACFTSAKVQKYKCWTPAVLVDFFLKY